MPFKVGDKVLYNEMEVEITEKFKGGKTSKVEMFCGFVTGIKHKPPTYMLSNGMRVRGDKIKKK